MTMLPKIVFVVTFLVSSVLYGLLCSFLVAVSENKDLTAAQYGISLAYGLLIATWLAAEAGFLVFRSQPRYASTASEDEEAASAEKVCAALLPPPPPMRRSASSGRVRPRGAVLGAHVHQLPHWASMRARSSPCLCRCALPPMPPVSPLLLPLLTMVHNRCRALRAAPSPQLMEEKGASDSEKGPLTPEAPKQNENARLFFITTGHMAGLRSAAEFVIIMGYVYVCDRTTLITKGPKQLTKTGAQPRSASAPRSPHPRPARTPRSPTRLTWPPASPPPCPAARPVSAAGCPPLASFS